MAEKKIPTRDEIDVKDTWDLTPLFPTDEAWSAELERARGYVDKVAAFRGRLGEDGGTLLAFLQLDDEISVTFDALINYAQRKSDEDTRVAKYQDMLAQLTALLVELNSAGAWETPELLAIPEDTLARFYADTPGLALYRRRLDSVRRRKDHILSDREEKLLASAGELAEAPDQIYSMLCDADMTFPDAVDAAGGHHPVSHGSYTALMQSQDRALRQSAFSSMYSVYGQFRNTAAATLSAQVKQLLFFARARNYPSTLDAALDATEVPTAVYRSLIDAVRANLPKLHRYVALRKKHMGLDELHMYDLYTPLVGELDLTVPFEEAKELTLAATAPLGADYAAVLREGFAHRWIDVYENQGKRSGGYSAGARVHPYVLLNYTGTLNDAFTLAHEMGHSLHSYLSNTHQPPVYSDYVIFVAEVASTCNEALLMEHLLATTTDMTFPDAVDAAGGHHPVSHGSYTALMQSQDRALRQSAFSSMYSVYGQFRNTAAATLSAQVKQLLFFARARNYPSTLDAALDATEVPTAVYRSLIDAVRANLPKLHRYVALRKKHMGLDELHMYDLYTPLVGELDLTVPFEEAKELTLAATAPLGADYAAVLREGFAHRWIDVYENQGKRSGGYSAGARVHPYVLLNYTGTLNDAFTLAHEMGHSLHSYLSNTHQPPVYSDYVIFVAEVASTCNEALLMEHLLATTTDKRRRAYLINYFLEQFRTTLYRQTMFAEFELKINELAQQGAGLTAEALCQIYAQLNRDYFGPDIVVDEEIALEWARIPHFYYNYYVYQYATGYAAAIALSRRILKEGQSAVDDYLNFLKGGCSADPITLLRGAGVDMASPQPVNDALALFDELITQLDELLTE